MADQMAPNHEETLASMREGQEQLLAAGRKTALDLIHTHAQTLCACADSQEKLAAVSEVEWVSRLLRAQAGFTREVAGATGNFARQLTEE
jgi:hypothetical protein